MSHMIPEGMTTSAPGLDAAAAYPQDFEGFKAGEKYPVDEVVGRLLNADDDVIASALADYLNGGKITQKDAEAVVDQIAAVRQVLHNSARS